MANASGLFKALTYKKEVTFGLVPAASGGQALRRISSTCLSKKTPTSRARFAQTSRSRTFVMASAG